MKVASNQRVNNDGVLKITIDGEARRFIPYTAPLKIQKVKKPKTWVKRNERKTRTDWERKGILVSLYKDNIFIADFISLAKVGEHIGLSKAQAHRIFKGKSKSIYQIKSKIK